MVFGLRFNNNDITPTFVANSGLCRLENENLGQATGECSSPGSPDKSLGRRNYVKTFSRF